MYFTVREWSLHTNCKRIAYVEPFYNAAISQFLIILGFPLRVIATSGFSQQCEIRAGGKTSEHNTYEPVD